MNNLPHIGVIFMSNAEKTALEIISKNIEEQLMWGNSDYFQKKAKESLKQLLIEKKVSRTQAKSLLQMINSPAKDNLDFARNLMETLSTQKSIQHVSHI